MASSEIPEVAGTVAMTTIVTDTAQLATIRDDALRILYVVIGCLGTIGNLTLVTVLTFFTSVNQKMTNLLIINQSFIDFCTSITMILMGIDRTSGTGMNNDSIRDQVVCRLWLTRWPLWSGLVASTYSILILDIERYIAIVHPIYYKTKVTKFKVYCAMAFSWAVGWLFDFAWKIFSTDVIDNACHPLTVWPSHQAHKATGIIIFLVQYLIPLVAMIMCYAKIFYVIRHKVTGIAETHQQHNDPVYEKAKRNVFRTLLTVSCCFLLCWSWNEIYYFLFTLGVSADFEGWFYHFTVIAVFLSCCLNPFIYAVKYKEFQEGFKRMLSKFSARLANVG